MALKVWDNPNNIVDIWIFDKFQVLPTDPRFLALYDEQKVALFEGLTSIPELPVLKKRLQIQRKIDEVESTKPRDFVSKGILKNMTRMFKADGRTDEEIDKELDRIGENIKKVELKNLEKALHGG